MIVEMVVSWHDDEDLVYCQSRDEDDTLAMGVDDKMPPFDL